MEKRRSEKADRAKIALLGFLLTICLLITFYFHFVLKTETVFTHLFYVPVILSALWWSRKGIAVAAFLALLLLVSHILSPLGPGSNETDAARALMFMVVGTVVAILREKKQILEDELRIYNDTLEQRIQERTNQLRQLEENQRAILDGIPGIVLVLGNDLNIIWANKFASDRYGVMVGKKCYKIFKGLEGPCPGCIAREAIADGIPRTWEENIPKDGKHIDFLVNCAPLKAPDGKVVSAVCTCHDITQFKLMTAQIRASLKEKEGLLREIHHRVKNNLQIISSLLDLSVMQISKQKAVGLLTDARSKIHTMALIHSQLYRSDRFDQIDMERNIHELVSSLSQIYASRLITPIIEVSGVHFSITQAIPCALVLNGLISNIFKHAFKAGQEGTAEISMRRSAEDTIFMSVKDDGIGIPDEIDIYKTDNLGLKLIRNLVQKQLKGKIEVKRNKGTQFIIEFKISE